jgi:16S rRNA (cytidine1402-2'-O)-methyltransferase
VSGRLVVCPTPIGNLEDVTLRVLSALREADVVACEDTRRTRVLLDRYGVKARLVSYHEHNERARAAELVSRMRGGETVALVSDAGMPLVSDPGYVLVRACVAAGLPVEVLPGPSAAITALVASGMPADEWHFHGFLPRKKGELRRVLAEPGGTVVAFESPRRVPGTLALLAELQPAREVAVCRELTKVHEEIVRGTAAELAARYAGKPPRGEVVLVLGPPGAGAGGEAAAAAGGGAAAATGAAGAAAGGGPASATDPAGVDALRRLVDAGAKPRKAASIVAELTGGSANELYRALASSD